MYDVTAIGELLIDFTPAGLNSEGAAMFARKPGGAPANVVAANGKLGGKTAFIGKVGKDQFGAFLQKTLADIGIDTVGIVFDQTIPTTLAFVQLDAHGNRSFSFYRKPGADLMLRAADIHQELIENCNIFHFGSVSLTADPSRSATIYAVDLAKSKGKIISFDPNFRPLLWDDIHVAKQQILIGLSLADIIKVSDEELELLTGTPDLSEGSRILAQHGASLVLISLGKNGCFYRRGNLIGQLPAYDAKTIDTNGAGDAFLGAVHHQLRGMTLQDVMRISRTGMENILSFANAVGALTTEKSGAISAMPTMEQISDFRKKIPLKTHNSDRLENATIKTTS